MIGRALRTVAAGTYLAIRLASATSENPYPLSPVNPTEAAECDAYQKRVSEIERTYTAAHEACLKENDQAPSRARTTPETCSKAACQGLHDVVYGPFAAQAQQALKACRDQVSAYQQQLQAEQAAIERQTQALDRASDELARQVGQNDQQAVNTRSLADQLRQQAASDAAVRPSLSGSQLASLDAIRQHLDIFKASAGLDANANVMLSTDSGHSGGLLSAFRDKVFDFAMDALKASGPAGKQVAELAEDVQIFKSRWNSFQTLADSDASIDKRLDALGDTAVALNNLVNPSNFLFPGLLNYGIITPYKGIYSAFEVGWASVDSPQAAAELQRIGSPGDVYRYYPFLDPKKWPNFVTIAHVPLSEFLAALGSGAQ